MAKLYLQVFHFGEALLADGFVGGAELLEMSLIHVVWRNTHMYVQKTCSRSQFISKHYTSSPYSSNAAAIEYTPVIGLLISLSTANCIVCAFVIYPKHDTKRI